MSLNKQVSRNGISLFVTGLLMLCLFPKSAGAQSSYEDMKPRIVITCDPELDDNNSLIRFYCTAVISKWKGLSMQAVVSTGKEMEREPNGLCPEENMHVSD
jgi:hypothetical protein